MLSSMPPNMRTCQATTSPRCKEGQLPNGRAALLDDETSLSTYCKRRDRPWPKLLVGTGSTSRCQHWKFQVSPAMTEMAPIGWGVTVGSRSTLAMPAEPELKIWPMYRPTLPATHRLPWLPLGLEIQEVPKLIQRHVLNQQRHIVAGCKIRSQAHEERGRPGRAQVGHAVARTKIRGLHDRVIGVRTSEAPTPARPNASRGSKARIDG